MRRPGGTSSGFPVLGPEDNPGGARWCTDDHAKRGQYAHAGGRLECIHRRIRTGDQCHGPATRGTNSCFHHAGMKKERAHVMGKARITAWTAEKARAGEPTVDPGLAVLGMLQQSWLRAGVYGRLLRQQVEQERRQRESLAAEMMGIGDGAATQPGTEGLIGHKWAAAGQDGALFKQSEEIRALAYLEAQERDRVVKFAKVAHDMKIGDRMASMAEQWGDSVATSVIALLDGLQLTPEQQAMVPMLVQSHLGSFELSGPGGQ